MSDASRASLTTASTAAGTSAASVVSVVTSYREHIQTTTTTTTLRAVPEHIDDPFAVNVLNGGGGGGDDDDDDVRVRFDSDPDRQLNPGMTDDEVILSGNAPNSEVFTFPPVTSGTPASSTPSSSPSSGKLLTDHYATFTPGHKVTSQYYYL